MFYEQKHSSNRDHLFISQRISQNASFPLHLHENFELIYVEEGALQTEIDGCTYQVTSGEGALVLPNQPHSFHTPSYSRSWVLIFSGDHLPELKKQISAQKLFSPIISPKLPDLFQRIHDAKANSFRLRSILYELAAIYVEGEPATPQATEDGTIVSKIIDYIHSNFTEQITLEKMAQDLCYSYRYLSGIINRFFKLTLPQVVNRYRINYACDLLLNSNEDVTKIALQCGFGSIRNFNRSFKEIMGTSPQKYRTQQWK